MIAKLFFITNKNSYGKRAFGIYTTSPSLLLRQAIQIPTQVERIRHYRSNMSSRLPCLCIGLARPSAELVSAAGEIDARLDPAKGALGTELERANEKNLDLEFMLVDLANKGGDDHLVELKRRLGEKQFAAISIGFGVRGNRDYTDTFEKLVNICVEMNSGAKFGFATWPDDVVASLERVLRRS